MFGLPNIGEHCSCNQPVNSRAPETPWYLQGHFPYLLFHRFHKVLVIAHAEEQDLQDWMTAVLVFAEPQHWPTTGQPVPTLFPCPRYTQVLPNLTPCWATMILCKLTENTPISNIYLAKGWSLGIANCIHSPTRQPHLCNSGAAFDVVTQRIKFL